jgi:metal-responsive CopG/Arc/MetJ family transcriptional regulator
MRPFQTFAESKAVVQLVLPQGWVERINRLALERGVNRSALIREAIARTYFELGAEAGNGRERAETSTGQRSAE